METNSKRYVSFFFFFFLQYPKISSFYTFLHFSTRFYALLRVSTLFYEFLRCSTLFYALLRSCSSTLFYTLPRKSCKSLELNFSRFFWFYLFQRGGTPKVPMMAYGDFWNFFHGPLWHFYYYFFYYLTKHEVIIAPNPPGGWYKEKKETEDVYFTTRHDWKSGAASQKFLDDWTEIKDHELGTFFFFLFSFFIHKHIYFTTSS